MESAANLTNRDDPIRDFQGWFQREYLNRRKKNESYSIRAFSNYLKIASGTVSHLLSGRRTPSGKFVEKLFTRLDATPKERALILSSIKAKNARAAKPTPAESRYELIAIDAFKLIADWYHYALLELISVRGFRFDHGWISSQLGISVTEVRQAISRLLRLDLVVERDGTLVKTHSFVSNAEDGVTNSALKKLQRHVLQKALDAIDNVPLEDKDITSMTMAIDIKKLPEARDRIAQFRREMCAFLEDGSQSRVFNLGIQLYPISKEIKE